MWSSQSTSHPIMSLYSLTKWHHQRMEQLGFSVVPLCGRERDRGVTKQGFNSKTWSSVICSGVSSSGEKLAQQKQHPAQKY